MAHFRNAVASRDAHITTLRAACGVLLVACGAMWWGWHSSPQHLTIHNPPDLRSGSVRKWWEVDPSTVYTFSFYVWQQLNSWPVNGAADYQRQIHALSPYFTPSCRVQLDADYLSRQSRSELKGRVRNIAEIPGRGYDASKSVQILGRDTWIAQLDMVTREFYAGEPVKDVYVRYPLRVVRDDTDPERNPFGLKIDCVAGSPQKLILPGEEAKKQP